MKYLTTIILFLFLVVGYGQKTKTESITIYGNCGMCKDRIENALDIVGVKNANWNIEAKVLRVVYNPSKISLEEIQRVCAKAGHASENTQVDASVYNNLHHCCKYEVPENLINKKK